MDRKKAHAIAKQKALNTYNKTLKSIAQQVQQGERGRVEQVETEYGGGTPYDPSKNVGGETLYGGESPVNRPGTFDKGWRGGRDRPETHQESVRQRAPVPPMDNADPDYVKWYQEQAEDMGTGSGLEGDPLDFSLADDKDNKVECPECGHCFVEKSDKKKEASTKLMRVANKYKSALKTLKK